jgi:hypothetical protein
VDWPARSKLAEPGLRSKIDVPSTLPWQGAALASDDAFLVPWPRASPSSRAREAVPRLRFGAGVRVGLSHADG